MRNQIVRAGSAAAVVAAMLVAVAGVLAAHEKGVLKLANRELVAGDSVRLTGEKLPRRGTIALQLSGVAGLIRLAEVRADGAGAFATVVLVPADLAAGPYRLVAVASDGDEVAALDVSVVHAASHAPATGHKVPDLTPSAEPLVLARARSLWVTRGAIAAIALALIGGVALLRRPAVTH